jgi:hypothetical protein
MKHLTTDELVDLLYGTAESGHMNDCAQCQARLEQLSERKAIAAEMRPEPDEFLFAQRRTIYARMGEQPHTRKWVPALAAAACLAAVGVLAHGPFEMRAPVSTVVQSAKTEVVDAQIFSDVYSMEQSMEPIAAQPIHALFEPDQQ